MVIKCARLAFSVSNPGQSFRSKKELNSRVVTCGCSQVFRRCNMDQTKKFVNIAGIPS